MNLWHATIRNGHVTVTNTESGTITQIQEVLDKFFKEGIERRQGTEDIVTIGMRGDGDEAMSEESDVAAATKR